MAQAPMFITKPGTAQGAAGSAGPPVSLRPGGASLRPGGAVLRPAAGRAWADEPADDDEQRKHDSRQAAILASAASWGTQPTAAAGSGGGGSSGNYPGFMFVCSSGTESECLRRALLGLQGHKFSSMSRIGPDTQLFLLNFNSHELHGPFQPDGAPGLDLVPEAWKPQNLRHESARGFPAQIRVKRQGYRKASHRAHGISAGPLDDAKTAMLAGRLNDDGAAGTVPLGSMRGGSSQDEGRTGATLRQAAAPAPQAAAQQPSAGGAAPIPDGTPGYLFVCSSATETECFSRQLFGLGAGRLKTMTSGIQEKTTPLFLLNFKTRKIHGVFEAVGAPAMNIEADAWCDHTHSNTYHHARARIPPVAEAACCPLSAGMRYKRCLV
jgi:hypothetical protein